MNPSSEKETKRTQETANILNFPRRGGWLLVLLFLLYLQLRIQTPWLTAVTTVLALLIFQLRRIANKIEKGVINPELPAGRLRKIKRGIYTMVRNIPFIRPPRPQVRALFGVDLEIGQGMFGLLGPNGAGKTTLMRIIVGVLERDRGSIKINERHLAEHREAFHGAIGYLPQDFGLYENMTPLEYLNYHALTNGIYEQTTRQALIEKLLNGVGLWERRDDKIKTFSGGMKQRVGIAQTLLHLPQIIILSTVAYFLHHVLNGKYRNTKLRQQIARLAQRGWLVRIKRGLYVVISDITSLAANNISLLRISNALNKHSYVSLSSALFYYGLVDQLLQSVTAITNIRTRQYQFQGFALPFPKCRMIFILGFRRNGWKGNW